MPYRGKQLKRDIGDTTSQEKLPNTVYKSGQQEGEKGENICR